MWSGHNTVKVLSDGMQTSGVQGHAPGKFCDLATTTETTSGGL